MADDKPGKPYPPRWAMIYTLALIVWIILDVLHGGRPWGSTPLVTVGCLGRQADRSRSGRAGLRGCGSCAPPLPPSDRLLPIHSPEGRCQGWPPRVR